MSEAEGSEGSEGAGGFLARIKDFDWLKIPGAVRAIAHVVTGVGSAGTAWLDVLQAKGEQVAQATRDRTAARKSIMAATAKAASAHAARNPELLDRMIDRFLAEELKRQENREAVAIEAGKLLDEEPPHADTKGPSEDWLNVFSAHAEKASSMKLQQHWAHVLAGEIRAPGTFSLATLQLFSILDPALAQDIETARAWMAHDEWIPVIGEIEQSPNFDVLARLDAAGIVIRSSSRIVSLRPGMPSSIPFQKHAIVLSSSQERDFKIAAALLTQTGKELLKIIMPKEDLDFIRRTASRLKSMGPAEVVQIGEIVTRGPDWALRLKIVEDIA
jgi:Protein of unknown function (DUF2806)